MLDRCQDQVHQIQGDPVEHDAGDDNVDIAVGTQRTGNGTEERAGSNSQQQAQVPRQLPGDRGIKADACARDILTGRADVEHADLIGEQDGQRTHQQRRRADERLAEILHAQLARRIMEEILQQGGHGLPCARGVDDEQDDIADGHAENDAQQRGQKGLEAVAAQQRLALFHAPCTSLFAPAI